MDPNHKKQWKIVLIVNLIIFILYAVIFGPEGLKGGSQNFAQAIFLACLAFQIGFNLLGLIVFYFLRKANIQRDLGRVYLITFGVAVLIVTSLSLYINLIVF